MANQFPRERLERIVAWVKPLLEEFDPSAVAATGHSGLIVGGALTYATGIPLLAVRRKSDRPIGHVSEVVSGLDLLSPPFKGYVFLDDFIAGGRTLRNAVDLIRQEAERIGELKAILLYSNLPERRYDERGFPGVPVIGGGIR